MDAIMVVTSYVHEKQIIYVHIEFMWSILNLNTLCMQEKQYIRNGWDHGEAIY